MERLHPVWRILISLIWLCVFVYQTNMMSMGMMDSFKWSISGAAFATWIYLCFKVKYVDPLRVLMEIEKQRREEELACQNENRQA